MPPRLRLLLGALLAVATLMGVTTGPGCRRAAPDKHVDAGLRLAVLSPALAQTLRDLDLGNAIVARHAFDTWSASSLPVVGDQSGIDYETLVRVRPTHVLLEAGQGGVPERLRALAQQSGWDVRAIPTLTLEDVRGSIEGLAALAGDASARARSVELATRFDEALRPDPDLAARAGRCLLLFGVQPPAAAGPACVHAQIAQRLGIALAVTRGGSYVELDPEAIRALKPDSAILIGQAEGGLASLQRLVGLAESEATVGGRVAAIGDSRAQLPATSLIDLAGELRSAVRSWGEPPAR